MNNRFPHMLIILICARTTLPYDVKCPQDGHRANRAKDKCNYLEQYTCLLIATKGMYEEGCIGPRKEIEGSKTTLNFYAGSTNFDAKECKPGKYQPYDFSTVKQSDCMFLKSQCNEEGQLLVNNSKIESTKSDVSCACDKENGYRFVTTPINKCFCIPSQEDCACVRIICKNGRSTDSQNCFDDTEEDCKEIAVVRNQRDTVPPMRKKPIENNISEKDLPVSNGTTAAFMVFALIAMMIIVLSMAISNQQKLETYIQFLLKCTTTKFCKDITKDSSRLNPETIQEMDASEAITFDLNLSRELIESSLQDNSRQSSENSSNVSFHSAEGSIENKEEENKLIYQTSVKGIAQSNDNKDTFDHKADINKVREQPSVEIRTQSNDNKDSFQLDNKENISKSSDEIPSESITQSSNTKDDKNISTSFSGNKAKTGESEEESSVETTKRSSDNVDICKDSNTNIHRKNKSENDNNQITLTTIDKSIDGETKTENYEDQSNNDIQVQPILKHNVKTQSTDKNDPHDPFEKLIQSTDHDKQLKQDTLSQSKEGERCSQINGDMTERVDQHITNTVSKRHNLEETKSTDSDEEKHEHPEENDNYEEKKEFKNSLIEEANPEEEKGDSCSDQESLDATVASESERGSFDNTDGNLTFIARESLDHLDNEALNEASETHEIESESFA